MRVLTGPGILFLPAVLREELELGGGTLGWATLKTGVVRGCRFDHRYFS